MIGVFPLLYLGWKFLKRTKIYKSEEVNLTENLKEIEDYQATYVPTPPRYVLFRQGYLIFDADERRNFVDRALDWVFG